jgi:hypothetical protein
VGSTTPSGTGVIHRTGEERIKSWIVATGAALTFLFGALQSPRARWFPFLLATILLIAAARSRRSGVRVDHAGVTIMNLVRDIRVPWADVDHFEIADDGPFSGWGRGRPTHRWLLSASRGWVPLDCAMSSMDGATRLVFLLEETRKAPPHPPSSSAP